MKVKSQAHYYYCLINDDDDDDALVIRVFAAATPAIWNLPDRTCQRRCDPHCCRPHRKTETAANFVKPKPSRKPQFFWQNQNENGVIFCQPHTPKFDARKLHKSLVQVSCMCVMCIRLSVL